MAKLSRKLTGAYLDTKGTLLCYFDERREGHKIGETSDVHYGYCRLWIAPAEDRHTMYGTPGRIIFPGDSDLLAMFRLSKGGRFQARMASVSNGSENTKRAGIAVQWVELRMAKGETISWHDFPGLMSPTFTIQQGEEYILPSDLRAGQNLNGYPHSLINKVTGTHPDAAKQEVA